MKSHFNRWIPERVILARGLRLSILRIGLTVLLACLPQHFGWAQDQSITADGDPMQADIARFTAARWSQTYPDRDFQGGCVMGFDAFEFSPTGYFIFNNHLHGSWRIDELGNLQLRTRDGQKIRLIVNGSSLSPTITTPYFKRANVYQLCDF